MIDLYYCAPQLYLNFNFGLKMLLIDIGEATLCERGASASNNFSKILVKTMNKFNISLLFSENIPLSIANFTYAPNKKILCVR